MPKTNDRLKGVDLFFNYCYYYFFKYLFVNED